MLERQERRNFLVNPNVSLLVVDPDDTGRYIQIRGDAELLTGARTSRRADPRVQAPPCYYGHIYPAEQRSREHG